MKKYFIFLMVALFMGPLSMAAQNTPTLTKGDVNNMTQLDVYASPNAKIVATTGKGKSGFTTAQDIADLASYALDSVVAFNSSSELEGDIYLTLPDGAILTGAKNVVNGVYTSNAPIPTDNTGTLTATAFPFQKTAQMSLFYPNGSNIVVFFLRLKNVRSLNGQSGDISLSVLSPGDTTGKNVSSFNGKKGDITYTGGETKLNVTGWGGNVGDWLEICSIPNGGNSLNMEIITEAVDHCKTYRLSIGFKGIPIATNPSWVTVTPEVKSDYYFNTDNYDLQIWSSRALTKLRVRRKAVVGSNANNIFVIIRSRKQNQGDIVVTPIVGSTGNEPNQSTQLYTSTPFSWHQDRLLIDPVTRSTTYNAGVRNIPQSRFQLAGSLGLPITTTAAIDYMATEDDFTIACNALNNNVTVALPDAATCKGRVYIVTKTDASTNFVASSGFQVTSKTAIWLQSDANGWVKIN